MFGVVGLGSVALLINGPERKDISAMYVIDINKDSKDDAVFMHMKNYGKYFHLANYSVYLSNTKTKEGDDFLKENYNHFFAKDVEISGKHIEEVFKHEDAIIWK